MVLVRDHQIEVSMMVTDYDHHTRFTPDHFRSQVDILYGFLQGPVHSARAETHLTTRAATTRRAPARAATFAITACRGTLHPTKYVAIVTRFALAGTTGYALFTVV